MDADTGALIPREIDGFVIPQRAKDGYVNATAMCQASGKTVMDYTRNETTKAFLAELEGSVGILTDLLIVAVAVGPNESRGTWVHPDVAVTLAQWCSPKFAARVSRWVREWMTTGQPPTAPAFRLPQTYAEALRQLADKTEITEQKRRKNRH